MSAEQNRATAIRFIRDVMNGRNLDSIDELIAPNFVLHGTSGAGDLDQVGLVALVSGFHAAFPDLACDVVHAIAEGDLVATHYRLSGTSASSGRSFDIIGIGVDRFVDGKLAEAWNAMDEVGMQQQLAG